MRLLISILLTLGIGTATYAQSNTSISAYLQERIQLGPNDWQEVYIVLSEQADLRQPDRPLYPRQQISASRIPQLIRQLQSVAQSTQGPVIQWLNQHPQWVDPQGLQAFWVQNLILARLRPEAIEALSQRNDIAQLIWAAPAVADELSSGPPDIGSAGGHEPGHEAIQATDLWRLGYTGYGRKVYIIDSGVEWEHPALKPTFWGNFVPVAQAWYHPNGNPFPMACNLHGTHVTGIITGLDPDNSDTVGVAFNASWMAAPSIGVSNVDCNVPIVSVVSALQWALNPDGDTTTTDDVPDVINNSWAINTPGPGDECNSIFSGIFDALELAGIAVVFSAGNSGPGSTSITSPKNIVNSPVNTFCVGNVNGNNPSFPIHNQSSLGPALCGDSTHNLFKPEVVAPGVNVRSTAPGGVYAGATGTSMSSAQVAGAILLLKEAFPQLSGTELKYALYETALDLGVPGEDNVYGQGLIQLKVAFDSLVNQGVPPSFSSSEHDIRLEKVVELSASICDSFVQPGLVLRNVGSNEIGAISLWYQYDQGIADTLHWSTQLGAGARDTVFLPLQNLTVGNHHLEVNVFAVNDTLDYHFLDNRSQRAFQISPAQAPSVQPVDMICEGSNAWLRSGAGEPLIWFEDAFSTLPLDTSISWLSPALSQAHTYYAAAPQSQRAGQADNVGDNGSYNEANGGLWFQAERSFILRSVLVFSVGDGVRTVELRDRNDQLLQSKDLFVNFGPRRLALDFYIPVGDSLQLRVVRNTGFPQFYSSYDSLAFPYELPGLLSIIGSDLIQAGEPIYSFLYDWEIAYEGCRVAVPVIVKPGKHQSQFSPDAGLIYLQNGGSVQFMDQSEHAVHWFWDFGDGNTSGLANPIHIYDSAAVYLVGLTSQDSSGCGDTEWQTLKVVDWNVGIDQPKGNMQVRLFPNPGTGLYQLEIDQLKASVVEWKLRDMQGRLCQFGEIEAQNQIRTELNFRSLARGIYLLELSGPSQGSLIKLVKN